MSDRFSLVRWRDAKTNPPEDGVKVLTSRGLDAPWYEQPPYTSDPDYFWCDPSPPDMSDPLGPLTVEDLRHILSMYDAWVPVVHKRDHDGASARIRRAIEEAER